MLEQSFHFELLHLKDKSLTLCSIQIYLKSETLFVQCLYPENAYDNESPASYVLRPNFEEKNQMISLHTWHISAEKQFQKAQALGAIMSE